MPYLPVLGRAQQKREAAAAAGPTLDRRRLIDAVAACQHQLADLLSRLDAGSPAGAEATAQVAPVRQAVEATLQQLDASGARGGAGQLTEFEERVWRRLVEAMRADSRRVEGDVRAALAAEVERVDLAHARAEATAMGRVANQLSALEERVARGMVEIARADARRLAGEMETLRRDVDALRRDQAARDADLRGMLEHHEVLRSTELATLGDTVERLDLEHARADATTTGHVANQLADLEERLAHELADVVRADLRRVETALGADVARLRADLDVLRREHGAREADLRGTLEHQDAVHASEMAGLGETLARVDASVRDVQTHLADHVDARLAGLEEQLGQRVGDMVRGEARRGEAGLQAELSALRSNVDDLRRRQAESDADLRDAIAQQDAARASEVAGLGGAIARLDMELARSMAAIDARIVHHVRRARIAVEEEMATLRHWVEGAVTTSTGTLWSTASRVLRDPLGALTAVVNLLIEG